MKHNMNRVLSTLALSLLTCIGLWAGEVIKVVKPNDAGTVKATVSDGVCTLTVTPATGFYLTADNLKAVVTLNENGMQAPRRNLPINPGEELLITPTDANANPSGVTTYTFNLPEDENINVEVTAVFQEGSYYNLKIGDTWVTSANAAALHEIDDEYISVAEGGSVSFDANTSTLTLNNATLMHGITSGLQELKIRFVGTNKVNSDSQENWQDTQDAAQNNAISTEVGTATLTFEKAGEGSLELYSKTSLFYPVIAGFASVGYGSGNNQCYLQTSNPSIYNAGSKSLVDFYQGGGITNATITSVVSYPLWVGSYPLVQVTEENKDNITGNFINEEGSLQYVPSSQKLSLINANLEGKIHSALGNLKLELTGFSQISVDSGALVRSANEGELQIIKKSGEANASLKLESNDSEWEPNYPVIQGFASLNYEGFNIAANGTNPAYGVFIGVPDQSGEYVSVYGLYDSDAESGGEKGITSATFTTADVFPLWVGGTQVTGDNAEDIIAEPIDGMVSFDEENKILTLNNTYISCQEILADFPIKSGYDDLTIKLIGNSYITIDSDYPSLIQYVGGQLEVSPQLTFMYDDNGDEGYGSLIISGIESPENLAEGYVVTNVLLSAEEHPSSTGWLYETDEEEGDFMLWYQEAYGIVVTKDGKSYGITKENISNVLGEEDTEPSVKFDGHGRLVLNKAQLTSISVASDNDLPIVDAQNKTKGLEIYLEGDNTITNNLGFAVKSEGAAADMNLTFLTGSDAPGTLTYTNEGDASVNVFPGFNVKCLNNLARTAAGNVTMVKIPLGLFVETVGTPVTVTYTSSPAGGDEISLDNDIYNDVLYTLDDNGTKESNDGYDQEKKMVVINTVMTDAEVKAIDTSETIPGTEAYSNAFKGLTLLVPAGTGTITLNNVQTAEGYAFHVMVGYQEPPLEIINNGTPANVTVSFACTETSYVKIYLVALPTPAPAYAQAVGGHRIGPKSSVAGGLGGISVQGNTINVAPNPAASYLMMTASDCTNDGGRGIKINNGNVTDLPPSAFSGISFVSPSPRRAPDANMKTYIDASGTMITGKNFSRTEGAFKDVPEETLIYLPAGNTAVGKNFIIGGICEEMELKATRVNPFEAAADFTAAKATFDRVFDKGDDKCYTIFLPYAINVSEVDGELFEYVSYNSAKETVNMNKLTAGATTPNKAYIFKPSNTAALKPMLNKQVKKQLAGTAAAPDDESEAEGLHGVYEYYMWTSKPSNVYCYSATDKNGILQGQFAKVGAKTHIKPFRAYLRLNTSSAPEFISVDWGDGMTSIVPLDKEQIHQDADGWYTISGFRLPNKPTEKGIYIHNHKKKVVK